VAETVSVVVVAVMLDVSVLERPVVLVVVAVVLDRVVDD
jgi:hypothetical protein